MIRLSLQHISKSFLIGFEKKQSVLSHIASYISARESKKLFKALDDVSLEVKSGEILGIIGSNGSGKSTLLRIMADIYKPDTGTVQNNGRIISIINLGAGLMERLPMRDNIYMVGALFGMDKKTITEKFDAIVAFSELEEFVGTKIYQFSAGMIQRLAFSIAIHSEPDILLLDEVFEVGDDHFRKKSAEKIKELVSHGASVILVSHDMELIQKNCTSVIEFKHGKIYKTYTAETFNLI